MEGDEGKVEQLQMEPSIYSSDPNERKLARRLRIKRRLEAAERIQAIADGTYVEAEPEKPLLDETIETSDDTLIQLFLEGKELVTNIRIASDAREVQRREEELEARNLRFKQLEQEAALAMEKLNEITGKWENIQDSNDPLDLHQDMKDQKTKCLELIEQKNELIKDFQAELKFADERFMKDRKKMYEDVAMLTKRIDEQVLVMKRGYRTELQIIEEAVDSTRTQILEKHQKTWQSLYDQRENDEVTNMDRKFAMVDNHEEELIKVHRDHEERFRETRIRLETDIQTLEQELEQVKALCLLNSEKLDYNYQVLKKREEENVYIKNHQKRRLNKLQDTVNILKKKIEEKQNATEQELQKLTQEVKRYHTNVVDIERKADHFSQVNEEKYQNIWDMKAEEAKEYLDKILTTDMVIHEQILGICWKPPEKQLLEKTELLSYKSALMVVCDIDNEENRKTPEMAGKESETPNLQLDVQQKRLLKHILEMVADQSGFLIEEKLDELLKPYRTEEKTFVRLDNVFVAIGIRTERDVEVMKNIFMPYAICDLCDGRKSEVSEDVLSSKSESDGGKKGDKSDSESWKERNKSEDQVIDSIPHPSGVSLKISPKDVCRKTHPLRIEKIYILKALRNFVTKFHAENCGVPTGMSVRLAKQRCTISRLISKEDVETYWQRFKEIFPPEEEKVWDALFVGLTKYHSILQDRHKLNLKSQKVRQQNLELKRLLAKYMADDNNGRGQRLCLPSLQNSSDTVIKSAYLKDLIDKVPF